MPLSMYGNTNPKGLEPFQIESTLAPLAVGNSRAEAQNMLDTYQAQRNAATGLYGQDLQQQHQAFYDQLAGQMAQAQMKTGADLLKLPGGASFVSQSPSMSAAFGAPTGAWTGLAQAGDTAQADINLKNAGTGINQASQGGFPTTPGAASAAMQLPIPAYVTPAINQAAATKGQYGLAESAMRAKAAGGSMTVPLKYGETASGEALTGPVKVPISASDAQVAAIANNARRIYGGFYPPGSGIAGATPPGADSAPPPQQQSMPAPQPPPNQTNLPMAQRDTGSGGGGQGNAAPASPRFITDPNTQRLAQRGLQYFTDPRVKMDIAANIQGGVMPIVPLQNGSIGYVGKHGGTYTLPPAPGSQQ